MKTIKRNAHADSLSQSLENERGFTWDLNESVKQRFIDDSCAAQKHHLVEPVRCLCAHSCATGIVIDLCQIKELTSSTILKASAKFAIKSEFPL